MLGDQRRKTQVSASRGGGQALGEALAEELGLQVIDNDKVMVSSRDVAEKFGKQHRRLVQTI